MKDFLIKVIQFFTFKFNYFEGDYRLFGGLNFYKYTHNPIDWVDPLGLKQRSLDEIKADRRRRENYKSGVYLKHTQAKM